jgi:hypothetical protein
MWVYVVATPADSIFFDTGTNGFVLSSNSSRQLEFVERIGTTAIIAASASTAISLNTWVHIAVVRSGTGTNQVALYINGTSVATGTSNHNFTSTTISIGARFAAFGGNWLAANAYISNVLYADSALTITLPTTPYTNAAGVKLLCLQDNRFKDNSTNAFAITVNGDTRISKFAPFNPPASYSTASYGGSGYFDGTGDYLSIADSATIRFGTGTFTIQGWVYRGAAGATHTIAAKGGASTGWVLQITSTNVLRFTDTTTNIDTTTTIPASTWVHVAVVRTGTGANGLKLYINAVDSATGTSGTNFNQTEALNIGADRSNANAFNGYISNLKYTVGTAESISVPASPITGGTVLLNFTNAGIFDAATINNGQTVGNAQVSTTQAKWGTTSMYFDGTGDYLQFPISAGTSTLAGNFTVEGWVYIQSLATARALINLGDSFTATGVTFYVTTTGRLGLFGNNAVLVNGTTQTVATNTWTHIAFVRSSNIVTLYVNGVADVTTLSNSTSFTGVCRIGAEIYNTSFLQALMLGYIQDARITNGYARYTANFTAPTAAFPTL